MILKKFKTKRVETILTVGECLKRKREDLKLSLKNISEKLKIKKIYLEDLEEGNHQNLPPDVYVRGFIKSYARFIELDPEKMADIYNRERKIKNKIEGNSKENKIYKTSFASRNYAIITPKIIAAFCTLLILSIVGYYLWHQISSFNSTPYLFISSPHKDWLVNDAHLIVTGETEQEAIVKINGQDVFVDLEGYFQENIVLQPGENVLVIEATNKFSKTAKEVRNIIYEKKLEPIYINLEDEDSINLEEVVEVEIEDIEDTKNIE